MSVFLADKDRRVIPRWRDFRVAAATGELDGEIRRSVRPLPEGGYFLEKIRAWEADHSVEHAADLLAAGLVLGHHQEVGEAARFILEHPSESMPSVSAVARMILSRTDDPAQGPEPESLDVTVGTDVVRLRVRALRGQLVDTPRNSFLWVDLARAYAMLGQSVHSVKAMNVALKLVPTNRFILRSAARLFVHLDEPDRAHELLRRNERTRRDPWLLSAEIAVASVAGRTSVFVKKARDILQSSSHSPSQTTELASALATLDLTAGDLRKARKLFRKSLADPTENAVAQAGWAARKIGGVEVDPELLMRPRSFEARAWAGFNSARFRDTIAHCENWLLDEQYSSRPAQMGSYVASIATEEFTLCEQFARRGLLANPNDPMLLNNLVVGLANQGRLEEAKREFAKIGQPASEETLQVTLLATAGLLKFRSGEIEGGRELYLKAIENADPKSFPRALAALHLAREEILAMTPNATRMLAIAEAECEPLKEGARPDIPLMLQRLRLRHQAAHDSSNITDTSGRS